MKPELAHRSDIPLIGFGTYLIDNEVAGALVRQAILSGYRHIDTAEGYDNEVGVGDGLRKGISDAVIYREDIFITTKLWPGNPDWGQTPKTYSDTIAALDNSLARLKLDYVDLYLIHAPFPTEHRIEQWQALFDLQNQGKTKLIGVSNYNDTHINELKTAGLPLPAANQIELHPWSQKPSLVSYLVNNGILPIAYSSLLPLSTWRAQKGQRSAKTAQMKADGDDPNRVFKLMATKYRVSEAQLLLKWALQKGYAILPKTADPNRLTENLDLFRFSIDTGDMSTIDLMDRGAAVAWSSGDPLTAT